MRALLCILLVVACSAQTLEQPSRGVADPGIVTTRQAITPAGVPSVFEGRVYGVAWAGTSGDLWVLHASQLYRLDWKNNRVAGRWPHGGTPGNQSLASDPVTGEAFLGQSVRAALRSEPTAGVSVTGNGELRKLAQDLGRYQPGAPSISAVPDAGGRRYAVVPLVWENKLAILDATTGEVVRQVETGIAPFAAIIDRKGTTAWVSNLGGRPPKPGESSAAPMHKRNERVVVDTARHRRHRDRHPCRPEDRRDSHDRRRPSPDRTGAGRTTRKALRRQRQ